MEMVQKITLSHKNGLEMMVLTHFRGSHFYQWAPKVRLLPLSSDQTKITWETRTAIVRIHVL